MIRTKLLTYRKRESEYLMFFDYQSKKYWLVGACILIRFETTVEGSSTHGHFFLFFIEQLIELNGK